MIIFIMCACTNMESSKNDDDIEQNYIAASANHEYKLLTMVQTGVTLYVNHFVKYNSKEPCRTPSHTRYSLVLKVLNGH